jgi:hypothetical protein
MVTVEVARELDNMAKGFGLRSMIEGFVNGSNGNSAAHTNGHSANGHTPPAVSPQSGDAVGSLLSQIGGLLQPALAKVTGNDPAKVTPELAEQVARNLADNPAFLIALQDALTAPMPAVGVVHAEVLPAAKSAPDTSKKGNLATPKS